MDILVFNIFSITSCRHSHPRKNITNTGKIKKGWLVTQYKDATVRNMLVNEGDIALSLTVLQLCLCLLVYSLVCATTTNEHTKPILLSQVSWLLVFFHYASPSWSLLYCSLCLSGKELEMSKLSGKQERIVWGKY